MVDYKSRASRPDPEIEKKSMGSGPVKSRFMSPEELEDYRARTGYKSPASELVKADPSTRVEQKTPKVKQDSPKRVERKTQSEPDKKAFLKLIAEGSTIAAAEQKLGLKVNGMYYWLKKWNLTGIKQDKAKELLGIVEQPEDHEVQNVSLSDYENKLKEWDSLQQKLVQQQKQISEYENRIADFEDELTRWVQSNNELLVHLSEMTEDRDNWRQTAQEAKQAFIEIGDEREMLLQTLENAVVSDAMYSPPHHLLREDHDSVNHSARYMQVDVGCIDAIDAAVTGLVGVYAYATGSAIKHLWRWQRENGIEDLRKAVWYINRMISQESDRDAGSVFSRDSMGNYS